MSVNILRRAILNLWGRSTTEDINAEWRKLVKVTIARFARGNISAQNGRILTEGEQEQEHARATELAHKWRQRADAA